MITHAMILAAGRGERMRPLTDHTPKALLNVAGKPLIQHHLERLQAANIPNIAINLGHLGDQIKGYLGDGSDYGVTIRYSQEPASALETGGGILQALALLGSEPFIVVNADIWCDYPLHTLHQVPISGLAHLVMVDNPPQNSAGDFTLTQNGTLYNDAAQGKRLTFSGIRVMRPELLAGCEPGRFSLVPYLRKAADNDQLSGEYYDGQWYDIGTPQRLQTLREQLGG